MWSDTIIIDKVNSFTKGEKAMDNRMTLRSLLHVLDDDIRYEVYGKERIYSPLVSHGDCLVNRVEKWENIIVIYIEE